MVNNPLKDYFLSTKAKEKLKTSKDIADYYNISPSIVGNALSNKTLNPSRKLVDTLSKNTNQKPELILRDIYNNSFVNYCNEYVKIITASLHYNFGYALFYDDYNYIDHGEITLKFCNELVPYYAVIRNNGPERKYTLVLDWSSINRALVDWCERTHNFLVKNGCILMAMSNLYYKICTDDFDDIKRMIVVFASDEEEDYQLFRKMCNDSKHRVLPLLYDDNAEYSIRDVDMLNG